MEIAEITLYNIARERFGDEKAREFVQAIKQTVTEKFDEKEKILATKEDIAKAKIETIKWFVVLWLTQMLTMIGLYIRG